MKLKLTLFLLISSLFCFAQDNAKFPKGYLPVKYLDELDGNWVVNNDVLKIDTVEMTIQFNDGMIMDLDYNTLPEYNHFYIYGRIPTINLNEIGRLIFRSRVRLSPDKKKIHLDRVDGGVSNIYLKM